MKFKYITAAAFIMFACLTANAQSGKKKPLPNKSPAPVEKKQEEKKVEKSGETRPVKIFRRPVPDVEVFGRCFKNDGLDYVKTVLQVVLAASATVTEVKIINQSGCQEFDEAAVEAAKGIKFEPALEDGEPISVNRTVIYQGGIR